MSRKNIRPSSGAQFGTSHAFAVRMQSGRTSSSTWAVTMPPKPRTWFLHALRGGGVPSTENRRDRRHWAIAKKPPARPMSRPVAALNS
ncbi:MAG: hypothetical protein IPP94_03945 [Ignavibacteria bacterium]|nr:hypothetical protein [Ignavibacteria bacterium]